MANSVQKMEVERGEKEDIVISLHTSSQTMNKILWQLYYQCIIELLQWQTIGHGTRWTSQQYH